ncbi:MAG: helix-turn-helix transcriptional regulator [Candidatus Kaiserbacteria bacterium]|nr:helix-turn-helix transcriptional regulator [Candidatus Kaiserbacteria bacterium]MCB9816657.1 helix-turn-helix transcriptional regulator [Candidatus Nomurabacteria bacterium]
MKQSPLQNNVHSFRTKNDLTQVDLADVVGVTRQTIISIEKGNYEPSVRLALKLAYALGVSVEELFYER